MKNKIQIVVGIIIILLVVLIIINIQNITNLYYNIRMSGVSKDIKITQEEDPVEPTGACGAYDEYYIDLNKKKIYKVQCNFNYATTSKKQETYILKKSKVLTDTEIKKILELTNLESDYIHNNKFTNNTAGDVNEENIKHSTNLISKYYRICYEGKTIELKTSTAEIIENIINEI